MTTRRRMLQATGAMVGAVTLSGCGLFDDDPEPAPEPDALQPVLDEAVALAAAYDRVALLQPAMAETLSTLAGNHRQHATELARVIGTTVPSAAPSASAATGGDDTVAGLKKAEQSGQRTAVAACKAAPAERAMLVGSIAAGRATHIEALR
ncbi:hypothetical protein [Actinoplanes sp. NPDC051851]|uniref:hypothetical protein n=1 Tax=Actinoplanes sp. NPDC051851 TaxID=3154753 RepID=UPI003436CA49